MMETQYIRLNMVPSGIIPIFNISQYDVGRKLGFYVHIGAIPVNLDNYTCTIEATRKDGVAIITPVETSNNVGTFEVTATMSNIVNRYLCQLVLVNENSKRVASLPFYINVIKAAMDENAEAIEEDASLYQQYTDAMQGTIAEVKSDLTREITDRNDAIIDVYSSISNEASARTQADNTLQSHINNEASARTQADNTLQSHINSEVSARTQADATINARIDNIVSPSGSAPSAAEVTDARVGADGTTYNNLGAAIRTQIKNLDDSLSLKARAYSVEPSLVNSSNLAKIYGFTPKILVGYNDQDESSNDSFSVLNSYIRLNKGDTLHFTNSTLASTAFYIALYNDNFEYIQRSGERIVVTNYNATYQMTQHDSVLLRISVLTSAIDTANIYIERYNETLTGDYKLKHALSNEFYLRKPTFSSNAYSALSSNYWWCYSNDVLKAGITYNVKLGQSVDAHTCYIALVGVDDLVVYGITEVTLTQGGTYETSITPPKDSYVIFKDLQYKEFSEGTQPLIRRFEPTETLEDGDEIVWDESEITTLSFDISIKGYITESMLVSKVTNLPTPKKGFVVVSPSGKDDYTSVAEAVENEKTGTLIIVKPGVYDGNIRAFQKRVNIIGTDREHCILRSTNGRYANPVMECCCGYLENLTFISQYVQGVSEEIGNQSGAYAVHCENNYNESLAMGDSLTFVNCNLVSDFFPALGVGTFADWALNLINCRLTTNQIEGRGAYSNNGSLGALYFHDMNGLRGVAEINVKDCIIENKNLEHTMCPYDLGHEGAEVVCEFINNTIYSAVNGFEDSIWWRGGQGAFGNNFKLSPLSHGNTGTEFNNPS